ncbi:hypothetical protein [Escherichia coli]|uniref:hypothetical protein n=1 Tax=Escherichia coli TaxID=562 RepID=UPI003D7FB5E7
MALALHHVFEILQFSASKPSTAREVRGIVTHAYKSSLRQFTLFSRYRWTLFLTSKTAPTKGVPYCDDLACSKTGLPYNIVRFPNGPLYVFRRVFVVSGVRVVRVREFMLNTTYSGAFSRN